VLGDRLGAPFGVAVVTLVAIFVPPSHAPDSPAAADHPTATTKIHSPARHFLQPRLSTALHDSLLDKGD
jgi:hypothetical protein